MYKNAKEIPESELPYQKCLQNGASVLTDAELLAVILRTGTNGKTAVELAQYLLVKSGSGLLGLYQMSLEDLQEIPGIGKVKAIQLKSIGEISKRIAAATHAKGVSLESAEKVAGYYMERLRHEEKENLLLCMFDTKCQWIGDEVISVGTINTSLVSPREIFLRAMEHHAAQVILLHNHPSGVPLPSQSDKQATNQVRQCGEMLGIRLSDHIIIGDNKYYSFKEHGLL